jgi:hypothetical protein
MTCMTYLGIAPWVASVARETVAQDITVYLSTAQDAKLSAAVAFTPGTRLNLTHQFSQAESSSRSGNYLSGNHLSGHDLTALQPLPSVWITAQSNSPNQPRSTPDSAATTPRTGSDSQTLGLWWLSLLLLPLAVIGGIFYGRKLASQDKALKQTPSPETVNPGDPLPAVSTEPALGPLPSAAEPLSNNALAPEEHTLARSPHLPLRETTRLSRVDIVETLIHDLHSLEPAQRRKAIWELGQRGDSRAIQPLVDLLMNSDSSQRSLILAAISEIGIHTLKPMNRALMMSLQDDSPEVRKNAIRDVTRLSDLVAQISQLLQYAVSDSDTEVRDTAQWALTQISRIRALSDAPPDRAESQDKE